jgi:hypothetical protein
MTPSNLWSGLLIVTILSGIPEQIQAQSEVHHHLSFKTGAQAATVTTTFHGLRGPELRIAMPRFSVRAGRLTDRSNVHHQLSITQAGNILTRSGQSWVVTTNGKTSISVKHQIPLTGRRLPGGLGQRQTHKFEQAGEAKTVRYHQGYSLPGVTTWLFAIANPSAPQRITFQMPGSFQVASALKQHPKGGYQASDYQHLLDSPLHIGTFQTLEFQAAGRTYRVYLTGFERDRTDRKTLQSELAKIAVSQQHSLGSSGTAAYVYLFGRSTQGPMTQGYHNSSEVLTHSLQSSYAQLLNISRAHAQSWCHLLHSHKLQQPPSGASNWFLQGVIEYFAELSLVRAGLHNAQTFWTTGIATHINKLQRDKRRLTVSVRDSGARQYQQGPKRLPAGPDPLTKGLLLGLLLDIDIRARTLSTRSLDNVLQSLVKRGAPVNDKAITEACTATLGKSLGSFFKAFVQGTDELPLRDYLARAGIGAQPKSVKPPAAGNPRMPKPARTRPPRWSLQWVKKPSSAAQQVRTQMTKIVAK